MAIDWTTATIQAIQRLTFRSGSSTFTRKELLAFELDRIAQDTQSEGVTPNQTLSRVLQELRDAGYLQFLEPGEYEYLQYRSLLSTISSMPRASEGSNVDSDSAFAIDIGDPTVSQRQQATVNRIIRNTAIVAQLKAAYDHRCQICGLTITLSDRNYCEGHHIRPLGTPHDGADTTSNIIIVCPNHHAMLDYGAIQLSIDSLQLIRHEIDEASLSYHNAKVYK